MRPPDQRILTSIRLPADGVADTAPRGFAARCEDALGAFFTAFVDCGVVMFFAMEAFVPKGNFGADPVLMTLGFLLALLLNGRHLIWLWIGWSWRQRPAAITTALQQKVRLVTLRPFISVWWFGCMLPPVLMVLAAHRMETEGEFDYARLAVNSLLAFGLMYAANGFLLLAVSVWTHSTTVLERVWRLRVWFDLGITVIGIVAGWARMTG